MSKLTRFGVIFAGGLIAIGAVSPFAYANHAWGPYHWARTSNPFTLKLGNNVSSTWDASLTLASTDWSQSSVLHTKVVPGLTSGRRCRASNGRVEVCNYNYGNNGWLGIAQIWVSGSHITQGVVKMNDTYFNTSQYDTSAWRNMVVCQEIGHTFGLNHQDENFYNTNLDTCMDYTSDPTSNQHPNQHDYDMLEIIYWHLDSITTLATSIVSKPALASDVTDDPSTWGKEIHTSSDRHSSVFERNAENGAKVMTHVFWADRGDQVGKSGENRNEGENK